MNKQNKIKEVKEIHKKTGDIKKTEKEFKFREKERNVKKRKKMDFRAIAGKMFKDHRAELPQPIKGFGPGMKAFCLDCDRYISKYSIEYNSMCEEVIHCKRCNGVNVKLEEK